MLHLYSENFELVTVDTWLIKEAIDISILNRLSYWDSMVIAASEKAKAFQLFTEDLNHKQVIRGVEIIIHFPECFFKDILKQK